MIMNKILCIVGSTGTGKTRKALELARSQPSILISADSRQVYRGMDIVTGKDHPKEATIYGVDIVDPDDECSVAVWHENVMPVITSAWADGKLPIVVGGTGLYIKVLTGGIETMQVPINNSLREQMKLLSIIELQDELRALNKDKFETMNHSDKYNSRRLIRAVEVEKYYQLNSKDISTQSINIEAKIIGLNSPEIDIYKEIIAKRVNSRISLGAIEETKSLLAKYDKSLPSMTAIGYISIAKYIQGECTREEMINAWIGGELAYAKRQMTWFRKQPVIWYDS